MVIQFAKPTRRRPRKPQTIPSSAVQLAERIAALSPEGARLVRKVIRLKEVRPYVTDLIEAVCDNLLAEVGECEN
jgi:hypothetical protein